MKFTLEIRIGNEAMQTPQDVQEAIARCAWPTLDADDLVVDHGNITDRNGNTVGSFAVVADAQDGAAEEDEEDDAD